MRVLVVGGTGLIGSHAAEMLRSRGYAVSIASRSTRPQAGFFSTFGFVRGNYLGGLSTKDLASYQAIVFAAGSDVRHIPPGEDENEFWLRTQIEGVPRFAALAREAGVRIFVHVCSYYHQVAPELVGRSIYVWARALADARTRALDSDGFRVMTLNPSSVVGITPGSSDGKFHRLFAWAAGLRPDVPNIAPPGGANYVSATSLAEAIVSAIERGSPATAYLVGDENIDFRQLFKKIFVIAGNPAELQIVDQEHPLHPDIIFPPGRGATIAFDQTHVEPHLNYRRFDIDRELRNIWETLSRMGQLPGAI